MPPKKKRSTVSTARKKQNPCRALMIIDETPIRRQAMQDCRKVMKQREKARQEWEMFDKKDRPAFSQWLHTQFGAQLTQLREIDQKLFEAEELIRNVEFEATVEEISDYEAYHRVMEARENPPEETFDEEEAEDGDDEGAWSDEDFSDDEFDPFDGMEDDLKDFLRQKFGFSEEEAEDVFERYSGRQGPRAATAEPCARIKEVYRALVRRLHPDIAKETDSTKQDLWHAVQEAYQARNLEQLEALLARCDIEEGVITETTPISQLQKSWREIKNALNSLRAQLRKARKDPAWRFSKRTEKEIASRRREIDRDIQSDLRSRGSLLEEMQGHIDRWEKQRQQWLQRQNNRRRTGPKMQDGNAERPKKTKRSSASENPYQGEFAF